jgi:hypothetical protein
MYAKSLDIVNKNNGPFSANAAAVLRNMSWLDYRKNDLSSAIRLKEKEVAIRRAILRPDHNPFTGDTVVLPGALGGRISGDGTDAVTEALAMASLDPWAEGYETPTRSGYSRGRDLYAHAPYAPDARDANPSDGEGPGCSGGGGHPLQRPQLSEETRLEVLASISTLQEHVATISVKGSNEYQPELASSMVGLAKLYKKRAYLRP